METKQIRIDVGSSTVKVYKYELETLELITTKSIHFKDGFDPSFGITEINKNEFFSYILQLKERYTGYQLKIYATAIFRKFEKQARVLFVDDFFDKTGLFFNIIEHDLEGYYLEMALVGKSNTEEPLLLINIGGAQQN